MASSSILPMGCRFSPSDADLISFYLRPMIAGEPLPEAAARFLHTADAYGADPAALVSGLLPAVPLAPKTGAERRCWYFFCSAKALSGHDKRRSRAVGGGEGTWHAEKGRAAVLDGEGRVVGYKQSFRYKPIHSDGSVEAVWLMVEFRVAHDRQGDDEKGETVPVLCKVYQSPRKPRSASVPTSPAYRRGRKRKAGDDSAPVKTVKRRLLVPPAAPILLSAVEPQPDLNNCSDGVSVDQLLDDLMSGLTPDQVLGDFLMPLPESDVNCSFSMANENSDQVFLGDLLMPVPEPVVNYSFCMPDHAGSMVSNYGTVLHGGSVTPLFHNSDQFDLSVPIIEPLPTDLQSQTAMLNFSFLSCAPYAGICDSWTVGESTDDEAASVSWYDSAQSSPEVPTEWMMQTPFATPYLF
ncbi:uncharacterized protein LOC119314434 [Triticum dicoccoides]|uniref:uncharacterized protein LOC119314434 n=3 Tax=Triticum dicoccoides TaxID=85692 RepID=UPI00189102E2|nr:uncharacterized protein LOC119314434 [Triticum dicoccoides]